MGGEDTEMGLDVVLCGKREKKGGEEELRFS